MKPTTGDLLDALDTARGHILSGRNGYLCSALAHVSDRHPELRDAEAFLHKYIVRELGRAASLGVWVGQQLGSMLALTCPVLGQQMRLAWIDRMVHELEKRGRLP